MVQLPRNQFAASVKQPKAPRSATAAHWRFAHSVLMTWSVWGRSELWNRGVSELTTVVQLAPISFLPFVSQV